MTNSRWTEARRVYDAVGPDQMLFTVVGFTTVALSAQLPAQGSEMLIQCVTTNLCLHLP